MHYITNRNLNLIQIKSTTPKYLDYVNDECNMLTKTFLDCVLTWRPYPTGRCETYREETGPTGSHKTTPEPVS